MKKFYSVIIILLISITSQAQAPEKMSFQAVVRNATNALVINKPVGMQISVLQGSINGTVVYTETQTPTSNQNGLVSLEIGSGVITKGKFNLIDWANGPYFIKTETDPTGGTSYSITGTSQLLSTPYALYAKTSGSSTPGPQGIQGPMGASGPQGITGLTGDIGPGGPQGPIGNPGVAGPVGSQGPIGLTGAIGHDGLQGPTGLTGDTGPIGPQGLIGNTGAAGPIGLPGPIGNTGEIGPQGAIGNTGAVGPIGPQGLVGNTGAIGPIGPQGTIGSTGAVGSQGLIGNTGAVGPVGPQGTIGNTGAAGPQGPIGNTGAAGAAGPQGTIGNTGAAGPQGATGPSYATILFDDAITDAPIAAFNTYNSTNSTQIYTRTITSAGVYLVTISLKSNLGDYITTYLKLNGNVISNGLGYQTTTDASVLNMTAVFNGVNGNTLSLLASGFQTDGILTKLTGRIQITKL